MRVYVYLYECRSRGSEKNSGLVHWVATLNISNIVKRETEKKETLKKSRKVETRRTSEADLGDIKVIF